MGKLDYYYVDWECFDENLPRLTERRWARYVELLQFIDKNKFLTYRNIQAEFNISSLSVVAHHIHQLIKRGFLKLNEERYSRKINSAIDILEQKAKYVLELIKKLKIQEGLV